MKKIFANLLALSVCAAAFGGCAKPEEKKYGAEEMTKAFWLSDTMYNESVMMVKEKDGAAPTGNLAFVPTGKVKVTNPTMTVTYEEGKDQPSFDKQFVRDWLTAHWDKTGNPPRLPQEIIDATSAKYIQAYETITGKKFDPATF